MDQIMFPLMTISLYLMTFSPDYVLNKYCYRYC